MRIIISKIIIKILFIKIFIYIIKMKNNFTIRIKKFLLKRKKKDFKNDEINIKFVFVTYYTIIKKIYIYNLNVVFAKKTFS